MRQASLLILTGILAAMIACSTTQEPVAREYTEPPELAALNDSVEAFAASTEATFEDYQGIYQHFLSLHPNSTILHREYQDLLDGFGKTTEKEQLYDSLYEANQGSAMYAYLAGRALTGERSRDLIRESVRLDSNFYWGHYGQAYVFLTSTPPDTAGAIEEYKKCAEIDNSNPSPLRQLVNIYQAQGRYQDALAVVKRLEVTMPHEFLPVAMKADIFSAMGDSTDAENTLLAYAEANPEHRAVRTELINMYKDANRWEDVFVFRHQLVKMSKEPAQETFELAEAYVNLDEPDSALSYVEAAAIAGFSDYHRLTKSPVLEPIRNLDKFPEIAVRVKENADREREERLADLMENEEQSKKDALKDELDIPAPDFSLTNLRGETVTLSSLRGDVVILDFWATWCGPCRMTMPLLQEYVDRRPDGVDFFSVNVWESDTSKVRPFLASFGYDFNVLFGDNALPAEYGVTGIPTLFVIDKEGIIRYRHIGYSPYADQLLRWQAESLL